MSLVQFRRLGIRTVLVIVLALVAVGCGGSDNADSSGNGGDTNEVNLDALQANIDLARDAGCSGCHTIDGKSSYGPTWEGLYGTEITLEDGTVRTADQEYIRTAIVDPSAERREGVSGTMPQNRLSEEEVDTLIELIQAIGVTTDTES